MLTKEPLIPIFEGIPNLQVFIADVNGRHKGLKGLWKLHKELMEYPISAVADLHNVLRSNILKRYFRLAKVPFAQINKGRSEKRALTSGKNKEFKPLKSTLQRYCEVFDSLGFPLQLPTVKPLEQKALSQQTLGLIGKDNRQKWIGIAPFAAFPGKTYPYKLMEEVIKGLDNTNKYKIFLFGGEEDRPPLIRTVNKSRNVVNMAGVVDLSQELELISHIDLMISMDSANAHLSAMYGIPTITLWGVTHPYAGFYPFGQDPDYALTSDRSRYPLIPTSIYGKKVPKGYEHVMETILPEQVLNKVYSVLS